MSDGLYQGNSDEVPKVQDEGKEGRDSVTKTEDAESMEVILGLTGKDSSSTAKRKKKRKGTTAGSPTRKSSRSRTRSRDSTRSSDQKPASRKRSTSAPLPTETKPADAPCRRAKKVDYLASRSSHTPLRRSKKDDPLRAHSDHMPAQRPKRSDSFSSQSSVSKRRTKKKPVKEDVEGVIPSGKIGLTNPPVPDKTDGSLGKKSKKKSSSDGKTSSHKGEDGKKEIKKNSSSSSTTKKKKKKDKASKVKAKSEMNLSSFAAGKPPRSPTRRAPARLGSFSELLASHSKIGVSVKALSPRFCRLNIDRNETRGNVTVGDLQVDLDDMESHGNLSFSGLNIDADV